MDTKPLWKITALFVGVFALVASLLVFAPRQTAWGLVEVGNEFFGGDLPHSLFLADVSYRAALAIDASVPDAWHQRARIAFLRGDFEESKRMINTQIALHGDSFMAAYYIRGLVYGFNKEYGPAIEDFKHFLTWDPDNWAANNDLAWLYFSQGRFEETKTQASRGLEANPGNAWLFTMRGMARFNLGERKEALADLLEARVAAERLTEDAWRKAYPGNDPRAATLGLAELRATIEKNIELIKASL